MKYLVFFKVTIFYSISIFCSEVPLKILFVTGYFPHISQMFIQDQIVECIRNDHSVYIHALRGTKHEKSQSDVAKYKLMNKTTFGKILRNLNSYDILYIQFGYLGSRIIEQARDYGFKGKIVVCFRGNDLTGYVRRDPHIYDELFKEADLFLPVCTYFKKKLMAMGCDKRKIRVHHSAIDTQKFAFKERSIDKTKPIILLTVARLTEKKGITYAIKTVARLINQYPNIRYIIIGDEDRNTGYRKKLENLIAEHHLENHVQLFGWATHEEMREILDTAHLFILPCTTGPDGDQEGIPNALKEAMALGIPVVSTRHAGNSELVTNGKNGFLVHEKDVVALTEAVIYLIEHNDIYKKFAQQGRKKVVQDFDIKTTVKKLETIFYDLIQKR